MRRALTDQPHYTKKYAHAAPIGRLGNRLLAAAYFGLTTAAIPSGPTLFLHLSWHTLTTSRGVDGAVERLHGRELELRARVAAVENATLKNARVVGGSERLARPLHLRTQNALSLALYGSDDEAARVTEPNTVFALLLDRPAITCIEDGKLTLRVEALDAAVDRRRQEALVAVFNKLALRCCGCARAMRRRGTDGDRGECRIPGNAVENCARERSRREGGITLG